ncbi:MAG: HutD/Ves family protein [Sulfitobacter sp.]
MQIVKHSELIKTPWKNGGGITRPIAKGLLADHPVWTLSRADVAQDGPFSDFSGYTRILTVVSGGAMALRGDGAALTAQLWEPLRFDGALRLTSTLLGGPLTDLNLMFDPAQCSGDVQVIRGAGTRRLASPAQGLRALHVLSGRPQIGTEHLTSGDTVFLDTAPAQITLTPQDALLDISLGYLDHSAAIRLCIAAR